MVQDEPSTGLDGKSLDFIAEALRNVVKKSDGVAVVVITHDFRMMKAADRVVALDRA